MRKILIIGFLLSLVVLIVASGSRTEKKADPVPEGWLTLETNQTLTIEPPPPKIQHSGFATGDYRQEIVAEAYELGGLAFVILLECENGLRDPERVGDAGKSHWLCQLNTRRHNEPLSEERNEWRNQLSVCFSKRKWGTNFYWPQRLIWGKRCSEVVNERFYIL